ncbi:transformation/transcription domain-associated protein [Pycnococcus provasolii]
MMEQRARSLLDDSKDASEKLAVMMEIKDDIEVVYSQRYGEFLKHLIPAFQHILRNVPVQRTRTTDQHRLRNLVLEVVHRLPPNELLRPYRSDIHDMCLGLLTPPPPSTAKTISVVNNADEPDAQNGAAAAAAADSTIMMMNDDNNNNKTLSYVDAVARCDNEENALVALRIVYDLHRHFRGHMEDCIAPVVTCVRTCLDHVQKRQLVQVSSNMRHHQHRDDGDDGGDDTTTSMAMEVDNNINNSEIPTNNAAADKRGEEEEEEEEEEDKASRGIIMGSSSSSDDSDTAMKASIASFRVLAELPLILMFLVQANPSVASERIVATLVEPFSQFVSQGSKFQPRRRHDGHGDNNTSSRASTEDDKKWMDPYITAQVKTITFLVYLLRLKDLAEAVNSHSVDICTGIVNLLTTCSDHAANRKELLVACRHILQTKFAQGLYEKVDELLNERVLVGSGMHCHEALRPLAYALLAELVHHVRAQLSLVQMHRVVQIFTRNVHDVSLPLSVRTTCVRILLYLVENIFGKRGEDVDEALEARKLLSSIFLRFSGIVCSMRDQIDGIKHRATAAGAAQLAKMSNHEYEGGISSEGNGDKKKKSSNGCDDDDDTTATAAATRTTTTEEDAAEICKEIADTRQHIRALVVGLKTLLWSLSNCSRFDIIAAPALSSDMAAAIEGGRRLQEDELHACARLFYDGAYSMTIDDKEFTSLERMRNSGFIPQTDQQSSFSASLSSSAGSNNSGRPRSRDASTGGSESDLSSVVAENYYLMITVLDKGTFYSIFSTKFNEIAETMAAVPAFAGVIGNVFSKSPHRVCAADVALASLVDDLLRTSGGGGDSTKEEEEVVVEVEEHDRLRRSRYEKVSLHLYNLSFSTLARAGPEGDRILASYISRLLRRCMTMLTTDSSSGKKMSFAGHVLRALFRTQQPHFSDIILREMCGVLPGLVQAITSAVALIEERRQRRCYIHHGSHSNGRISQQNDSDNDHRHQQWDGYYDDDSCGGGESELFTVRDVLVEICLTIPVRLQYLLPHLTLLMRPLVVSLRAWKGDLITLGLRTLEYWIESLNPEFLEPSMAQEEGALLTALWQLLHINADTTTSNYSFRTLQLLGRLGGRNRRFLLRDPMQIEYKNPEHGLRALLAFENHSKSFLIPLDQIVSMTRSFLLSTSSHCRTEDCGGTTRSTAEEHPDELYHHRIQAIRILRTSLVLFLKLPELACGTTAAQMEQCKDEKNEEQSRAVAAAADVVEVAQTAEEMHHRDEGEEEGDDPAEPSSTEPARVPDGATTTKPNDEQPREEENVATDHQSAQPTLTNSRIQQQKTNIERNAQQTTVLRQILATVIAASDTAEMKDVDETFADDVTRHFAILFASMDKPAGGDDAGTATAGAATPLLPPRVVVDGDDDPSSQQQEAAPGTASSSEAQDLRRLDPVLFLDAIVELLGDSDRHAKAALHSLDVFVDTTLALHAAQSSGGDGKEKKSDTAKKGVPEEEGGGDAAADDDEGAAAAAAAMDVDTEASPQAEEAAAPSTLPTVLDKLTKRLVHALWCVHGAGGSGPIEAILLVLNKLPESWMQKHLTSITCALLQSMRNLHVHAKADLAYAKDALLRVIDLVHIRELRAATAADTDEKNTPATPKAAGESAVDAALGGGDDTTKAAEAPEAGGGEKNAAEEGAPADDTAKTTPDGGGAVDSVSPSGGGDDGGGADADRNQADTTPATAVEPTAAAADAVAGKGADASGKATATPSQTPPSDMHQVVSVLSREILSTTSSAAAASGAREAIERLAERAKCTPSFLITSTHEKSHELVEQLLRQSLKNRTVRNQQMLAVKAVTFCVSVEPPLLTKLDEMDMMLVFLSDAASLAELENYPNMVLADLQRLRAACIDLLAAAIAWEPFKTTTAENAVKLRNRAIAVFFKSFVSPSSEIVQAAKTGLKVAIQNSKLPKELLQNGLRPILQNLADHKKLTLDLLHGLGHLLELLSNWFNITLGEKLMEHLKKWLEPERLIGGGSTVKWRHGEEAKIAAATLKLFHKLPDAAVKFLETQGSRPGLVVLVTQLEAALPMAGPDSELMSPYLPPLALFLSRYAAQSAQYFLDRLDQEEYSRRLVRLLPLPEAEKLRDEVAQKAMQIVQYCFGSVRPEGSPEPPYTAQYSGVRLIWTLHKLKPGWLAEQTGVVTELRKRWIILAQFLEQLNENQRPEDVVKYGRLPLHFKEGRWILKMLVDTVRCNHSRNLRLIIDIVRAVGSSVGTGLAGIRAEAKGKEREFIPSGPGLLPDLTFLHVFFREIAEEWDAKDRADVLQYVLMFAKESIALSKKGTPHQFHIARLIDVLVLPMLETASARGDINVVVNQESVKYITQNILGSEDASSAAAAPSAGGDDDKAGEAAPVVPTTAVTAGGRDFEEVLRIQLLRLSTLLIRKIPNALTPHRRELLRFGWKHLKGNDAISRERHWAFLNVACFLTAFQTPSKIVLQVYVAMLRIVQSESRALVERGLDVLVPALPRLFAPGSSASSHGLNQPSGSGSSLGRLQSIKLTRTRSLFDQSHVEGTQEKTDDDEMVAATDLSITPTDDHERAIWMLYTKKLVIDEAHNFPTITHILHTIARHKDVFFSGRVHFLPQMINSLTRIGLSQNATLEHRLLALNLVQCMYTWEARAEKDATETNQTGVLRMTGVMHELIASFLTRFALSMILDKRDTDVKALVPRALKLFDDGVKRWARHDGCTLRIPYVNETLPQIFQQAEATLERQLTDDRHQTVLQCPPVVAMEIFARLLHANRTIFLKHNQDLFARAVRFVFKMSKSCDHGTDTIAEVACTALATLYDRTKENTAGTATTLPDPLVTARSHIEHTMEEHFSSLMDGAKHLHEIVSHSPADRRGIQYLLYRAGLSLQLLVRISRSSEAGEMHGFIPRVVQILHLCTRDMSASGARASRGTDDASFDVNRQGSVGVNSNFDSVERGRAIVACLQFLEANMAKLCADATVKSPLVQSLVMIVTTKADANAEVHDALLTFVDTWCSVLMQQAYSTTSETLDHVVPGEGTRLVEDGTNSSGDRATASQTLSCFNVSSEMIAVLQRLAQLERFLHSHMDPTAEAWRNKLLGILLKMCSSVDDMSSDVDGLPQSDGMTRLRVLRDDVFSKVESCFLIGLRSRNPRIRSRMFRLHEQRVPLTPFERLKHILHTQEWEAMSNNFWLSHGCDFLLSSVVESDILTSSPLPDSDGRDDILSQITPSDEKDSTIRTLLERHSSFLKRAGALRAKDLVRPLREMAHADVSIAYHIWVILFPIVWATLHKEEQVILAKPIITLLRKECHQRQRHLRPNVVQALLEGVSLSQPQPKIPSELIKFLGKTYNAWHISIPLLESHVMLFPTEIRCFDALAELYHLLGEDDNLFGLWKRRARFPETRQILTLVQHGLLPRAQEVLEDMLSKHQGSQLPQGPHKAEIVLWEDQWVETARQLNQWEMLADFAKEVDHHELLMDSLWKVSDWQKLKNDVLPRATAQVEETPHLMMVRACTSLSHNSVPHAEQYIKHGMILALQRWWQLPELSMSSHIPLLHTFQRLMELQESARVIADVSSASVEYLRRSSNFNEIRDVLETWRLRLPNVWDPLVVWSDVLAWRERIYTALLSAFHHFQDTNATMVHMCRKDKAWSRSLLASVARKQGLQSASMEVLSRGIPTTDLSAVGSLSTVQGFAEALLEMPDKADHMSGLQLMNSTDLTFSSSRDCAEVFRLKGSFLEKLGRSEEANIAFADAAKMHGPLSSVWVSWGCFCDRQHRSLQEQSTQQQQLQQQHVPPWLENAIICYLMGAATGSDDAKRSYLCRCLHLISDPDTKSDTRAPMVAFATNATKVALPAWLPWVSMLFTTLLFTSDVKMLGDLLGKLSLYAPQVVYYHLRTFLLEMQECQSRAERDAEKSKQHRRAAAAAAAKVNDLQSDPTIVLNASDASEDEPDLFHERFARLSSLAIPAIDCVRALREIIGKHHFHLVLEVEQLIKELSSRFSPGPEERLLQIVHALLNKCWKAYPQTTSVPSILKRDLQGICDVIFNDERTSASRRFNARYRERFENDLLPRDSSGNPKESFPTTLDELTSRLKWWRTTLRADVDWLFPHDLMLEREAPNLAAMQPQFLDMPSNLVNLESDFDPYRPHRLAMIGRTVSISRRDCQADRRLEFVGMDGKTQLFLVQTAPKRSTERMMHFYRQMNSLLARHAESRRRHLRYRAPTLLPVWSGSTNASGSADNHRGDCLSSSMGSGGRSWLVEDDASHASLLEAFEITYARHGRDVDVPLRHFAKLALGTGMEHADDMQTDAQRHDACCHAYEDTCKIVSENLLSQYMYKTLPTCNHLWSFKRSFLAHYALSVFSGNLFIVGHRTPSRLLLSRNSGAVVQVDFFPNYGANGLLENAEAVPFRLTRNLHTFLTPFGVDGGMAVAIGAAAQAIFQSHSCANSRFALLFRDELCTWRSPSMREMLDSKNTVSPSPSVQLYHTPGSFKLRDVIHANARACAIRAIRMHPECSALMADVTSLLNDIVTSAPWRSGHRSAIGDEEEESLDALMQVATQPRALSAMESTWMPWL